MIWTNQGRMLSYLLASSLLLLDGIQLCPLRIGWVHNDTSLIDGHHGIIWLRVTTLPGLALPPPLRHSVAGPRAIVQTTNWCYQALLYTISRSLPNCAPCTAKPALGSAAGAA
ncbi:hypothetical protein HYPSUDRAFT_907964 [Hypholoma sublateritium FD-334 SS-4]|uniref:Secreted protein n=1 Tax=Hypholoma sublateritium (strain FD-334 SS-4) TaxID=945553 RepID=A0A0D2PGE1_HYPSF|nr:hypothetical protein HYPSUDRAFT_907964 [Hypholoma sublateritium FD-334 SS-4]